MTGTGTYTCFLPSVLVGHPTGADLTRTAEELAICALGTSPYRARFLLHGAWAVAAWVGRLPRPTQGIDLLDQGHGSVEDVLATLHAGLGRSPGGLALDWPRVRVRTKAERRSPLHRISIPARLGHRQLDLRIEVMAARSAIPDVKVSPLHGAADSSVLIWAACCGVDELVAEKTALLLTYGADHTRLQDVFDLRLLSEKFCFDRLALIKAFASNFEGRDAARMLSRNDGYWEGAFDPDRVTPAEEARWAAFSGMAERSARPGDLAVTLTDLGRFLIPVLQAIREGSKVRAEWEPGTGWTPEVHYWPGQDRRADRSARSDFQKDAIMMKGSGRK